MGEFQPPRDGSVLIIDDRVEEALPLLKLLSRGGVACTYYSGKDLELPEKPVQKIRLAFIDIQLFPSSDANTYAQNVLRLLDRIVPDENGPYILIVWSKFEDVYADELERQITSPTYNKRPVVFSRLSKADYFQAKTDDSLEDFLEGVYSSLEIRFSEEDLTAIKSVIDEKKPVITTWEAKDNALELIYKALQTRLEEADTFQLFTIWENLINKASGGIVKSFSALYPADEYWRDNLKSGIYRMAHAQLGKTIKSVDENELIRNALKTLNHSFLDVLENEISEIKDLSGTITVNKNAIFFTKKVNNKEYRIKWNTRSEKYQLLIDGGRVPLGDPKETRELAKISNWGSTQQEKDTIAELIKEYVSISPEINTRLLIDFPESRSIKPGNVYEKKGIHWKRKRNILRSYCKPDSNILSKDTDGNYKVANTELKRFIFIELEVTPICDYIQDKWIKSRLLPGVLIPENYQDAIQDGSTSISVKL